VTGLASAGVEMEATVRRVMALMVLNITFLRLRSVTVSLFG